MYSETDAANFFVAGGTLRYDSPSYVKRPADDELFNLALAGEFCYVLTARQMGKSSLMIHTARRLKEAGASSVIIDLTKIGTDVSVEQWYLGLITQLKRRLRLAVDTIAWWAEHANLGHVQRFTDFLHDVVLNEIEGQVVIFMDEIDTTLNLAFSDDFFAAIRAFYNARATDPAYERLTFVLLGVATPADLIKDRRRTPFNIGQAIDLSDFKEQDAQVLRLGVETTQPDNGEALFRRIYHWTHGHPYLTQKLCLSVTENQNGGWTTAQIDSLVETLFLSKEARKETNLQFVRDSVASSPQKRQLLKLYHKVYQGKPIADDERSLIQNQLKLYGLVRVQENRLQVRNEIYRHAFNSEWIKENTPVDWTRRLVMALLAIVILLAGLLWFSAFRQQQQPIDEQAQQLTRSFRSASDPETRLVSLAGLFDIPTYKDHARDLFFNELTAEDRLALFSVTPSEETDTASILTVQGIYNTLENSERDNGLLRAMMVPIEQIDDARASTLTTEIELWLQGRDFYNQAEYQQAVTVYGLVLNQNDRNAGLYQDRAMAYLALNEPDKALADFESVLRLDESRQKRIAQIVSGDGDLYEALRTERGAHQLLAALVPTATSTPTPTSTHTSTPIPTPTATHTTTPTPTPSATPTPSQTPVTATDTPTQAIVVIVPTDTPSPTPTPTPRPATIVYVQGKNTLHTLGLVRSGGQDIDLKLHEFAAAPAWSPDGKRIAFFGESGISQLGGIYGEGNGIWMMDVATRGIQQLVKVDHVKNIAWSWDGNRLAFEVGPPGVAHQVVVVDAATGQELSRFPGEQPAWRDDNVTLAIKSCAPECGLWLVGIDGSEGRLLTNDSTDSYPAWSPSGDHLVFTSRGRSGDWELYRLNPEDRTLRQLTQRSGTDVTPAFSPDGREIYFRTDVAGSWQIRAINPEGQFERLVRDNVGPSDDWGLARPAVN